MLFPTVQFAIFFPVVLTLSWLLMSRPRLWKPFIVLGELRLLRGGELALLPAAGRRHARQPARPRSSIAPDRGRAAPQVILGVRGRARPRRPRPCSSTTASSCRASGTGSTPSGSACRCRCWRSRCPSGSASSRSRRSRTWSTSSGALVEPASLIDVAVYLSFFPHLVAGPIVRAKEFLPQLEKPRDPSRVAVGVGHRADRPRAGEEGRDRRLPGAVGGRPGVRRAAGLRRRPTSGSPPTPTPRRSTATSPATPTWRSAWRCSWATSSRRTSAARTARPASATSGGAGT